MKLLTPLETTVTITVTPYVGVWIETGEGTIVNMPRSVTPYVGVWIETLGYLISGSIMRGHSLRGSVD